MINMKRIPERVKELLEQEGVLTQRDLIKKTGYSKRSIQYSVKVLKDRGEIRELLYIKDFRMKAYEVIS